MHKKFTKERFFLLKRDFFFNIFFKKALKLSYPDIIHLYNRNSKV